MDAVERLARALYRVELLTQSPALEPEVVEEWIDKYPLSRDYHKSQAESLLTELQAPQYGLIEKWRLAARIADNLAVQGKNWEEGYEALTEKAEELRKRAAELERTLEGRSDDR